MTKDLSEGAVSDIFVNIWLKRGMIEIDTNVKSYLYKSVRNQSLNYIKKYYRLSAEVESIENLELAGHYNFIQEYETNEEVENLLMSLPARRKLVFKMSRIDGLKYSEIAEILSISVNTVQNHIIEAVKTILAGKSK
jgi:RNA polymerase sigma-70 factor (ECF subfamily)